MIDRPNDEGWLERLGLKSRVARRLLGWALLIGVAASLLASVTGTLVNHRQRVEFMASHLKSAGDFAMPALVQSTWAFDEEQTRLQLDGLSRMADVTTVRLSQKDRPELLYGERELPPNRLERSVELVHVQDGKRHDLGTLTLIADLREARAGALRHGAIALAGNAFVIFSVLAILSMVHHTLVTRRLLATAGDLRHVTADDLRASVVEPAAPVRSAGRDELDELMDAVVKLKHTGSQALREADERHAHLRQLMDTMPDLVWLKDPDGVFLSCNKEFERLYGAQEGDLVGKTDHDFVPRELADFFRRNDMAAASAGKPTVNEEWLTFADGGYRGLFETTKAPILMRDGTLKGVLGIAHDITQRTRDHERVRASEARFRAIFEGAQDGVLLTDVETRRFVDANPTLCAMLGHDREALLSMGPADIYPEADLARAADTFDRQARGERVSAQTFSVRRKDASVFQADISVAPFELDGRRYLAGFFRDISERQRLEESANQAHRMLVEAISSLSHGFTLYDADDRLLLCNEAYREFYNTSRDVIVPGNRFEDIIRTGAQRGQYKAAVGRIDEWVSERVAAHRAADGSEIEQRLDDGRWLLIIEHRTPSGFIVGNRVDITARKRAEEELRASEEEYRGIFDESVAAIYVFDSQQRFVDANLAGLDLLGYTRNELMQMCASDVTDGLMEMAPACQQMLGGGRIVNLEHPLRRKDGQVITVLNNSRPLTDADGQVTGMLSTVFDISERKRAELALEQHRQDLEALVKERTAALAGRERHLAVILNGIPGIVGYWDRDQINRFANPAYREWLGLRTEQVEGRSLREVVGAERYESISPFIEAVLRGEPQSFERAYPRPGNPQSQRYAQVHYIPDREGDTVQGFFVMAFDIDRLKAATAAAQAASIAKSEFLANMSHEIRTPMNGVVGMTDILQQSELTPSQRRMVGTIQDSALALLGILNDILDVSKIEAGKLTVESIPTALRETVDGVLQFMHNHASAKNVQVGVGVDPDVPGWILSDPTRLRQILMNLLGNAIKFTAGRTERAARVSLHVQRCRLDDDRAGLRLDIIDNGIGMSDESIACLFQPFTQASTSTARQFGGTGLGLSITHRLVSLMQGRMHVSSRLGEGSKFTVELPLIESVPGFTPAPEPLPLPLRAVQPTVAQAFADHRLILLAEDNEINSQVMCEQLGLIGYAAEVAGDGELALQMWRSGRYALLLTDCHMPRMDGFELTAAIRQAEPPGTHLPIVAVTANAMQGEAERCLARGFDAYLSKPLRLQELAGLLARWLPQGQARPADPLPPTTPEATVPVWDADALTRLFGPKPALQHKVLHKFLTDTQDRITAIEQALAAGHFGGVAFDAHALKSAAATVGAMVLSGLCQSLEDAGTAGSQDDCDRLVPALREAFDAAAERIRRVIPRQG